MWTIKKIFFMSFVFFLAHNCVEANIFTEQKVWNITLRYITYPVNSDVYSLHVVTSEIATNIDTLAISKNAISWINGVFFCPADYSQCWERSFTINERFVNWYDNSHYNESGERGVFWWDKSWVPFIYQSMRLNADKRWDIYEWLGNFPIIFFEWRNMLEHYHNIGLYDRKMSTPTQRHFICSTKSWDEIFFWSSSSISLDWLAPALFHIGCYNALNLDAWASTQYLYNGRRLANGSRNILDGFVISHRDINIQKIEWEIEQIAQIIESKLGNNTDTERSQKVLDIFIWHLRDIRNEIYNQYSIELQDELWFRIWYRLEVTDTNVLRTVYIINKLERRLRNVRF